MNRYLCVCTHANEYMGLISIFVSFDYFDGKESIMIDYEMEGLLKGWVFFREKSLFLINQTVKKLHILKKNWDHQVRCD